MPRVDATQSLVDLRIEIPGGQHARYDYDARLGALRLAEVVYPEERAPADRCAVAGTLTDGGAPLAALLLGNTSLAAGCRVWARPIGAVTIREGKEARLSLIAVAADDPHFAEAAEPADLSPERRQAVEHFLAPGGATLEWLGSATAWQTIHAARRAYRLGRMRQSGAARPAWQPLAAQAGAANESERHTAAEYSLRSLPFRFQRYVEEYLAPDERVLDAVARPAMRGARAGRWRGRPRLEEGILAVTDQQVSYVVELLPPDSAGIRYGFVARAAPPERLACAQVRRLGDSALALDLTLRAAEGEEHVSWQFSPGGWSALNRVAALLAGWLPREEDRRLRRAEPPCPPQRFPDLRDPAANDPAETVPTAERLLAALDEALAPGETILARALLPAWLENRDEAALLAVSNRRVRVIPDPERRGRRAARSDVDVEIARISSLAYCSSILESYLTMFVPRMGQVEQITIAFPMTGAGFRECYLMLRRAMARC